MDLLEAIIELLEILRKDSLESFVSNASNTKITYL